jgi:hypothetical protein
MKRREVITLIGGAYRRFCGDHSLNLYFQSIVTCRQQVHDAASNKKPTEKQISELRRRA